MKVKVENVRLAFLQLFQPKAFQGDGKPKFQAQLIINPKSRAVETLQAAMEAVSVEKWGAKGKATLAELVKKDRVCFQRHAKCNAEGAPYDGFEGMYFCSASNEARPLALNKDRSPAVEADGTIYSGCYADVVIDVWAQDNQFGKRVNATLKGVQFRADGDAFSGGTPASADDFDDLSVESEETADDLY